MQDPENFYKSACDWIKGNVRANEHVGLAVSGGIDSNVAAALLRDAIGENLHLIHMDHGFMRLIDGKEESELVAASFADYPDMDCRLDVRERFYDAVSGIEDGDQKRAAFRDVYTTVLNESMEPKGCIWTADGTIAPDIRETRGGIKLQHNVDLDFAQKKLEPLASLSKQEVRALARYMGLPYLRQPFPGPGLLVRAVGVYSPDKLDTEKKANDIVEQEYLGFMRRRYGRDMVIDGETGLQIPFQTFAATFDNVMEERPWRASPGDSMLAIRLATRATGLVDDGTDYRRVYKRPLVVFDGDRSYANIAERAAQLAEDNDTSRVLYCLGEQGNGPFAVAIRAIDSVDVKSAVPNLSGDVPYRAASRILDELPVGMVMLDVTPKPPATVEYE